MVDFAKLLGGDAVRQAQEAFGQMAADAQQIRENTAAIGSRLAAIDANQAEFQNQLAVLIREQSAATAAIVELSALIAAKGISENARHEHTG